jgi:hypothetical protein
MGFMLACFPLNENSSQLIEILAFFGWGFEGVKGLEGVFVYVLEN